jgi:hypothetical protein
LTNQYFSQQLITTNTTTGLTNYWNVNAFSSEPFPFPSTYNGTNVYLPYFGFAPNGQLTTNGGDVYILVSTGSLLIPTDQNNNPQFYPKPTWTEQPMGNVTNNPNIIHVDWLTGRAKIEHNQF